MASQINLNFGNRNDGVKDELEKRAAEMDMSMSKYCIMVLTRHVTSGERFAVVEQR